MNKVGTAYVLWLGGLVGLAGLHRLYNGKTWTGLLWLFSGGLFGVGQLLDLVLIPKMVDNHNARLLEPQNVSSFSASLYQPAIQRLVEPSDLQQAYRNQAIVDLLKAAEAKGGKLSVTQGVIATGLSFFQVEEMLQEMLRTGYVEIGNDPETGVVVYDFKEM
jgi:TM2 domain-containing membrane protein YozV/predicted transcriptional regulator